MQEKKKERGLHTIEGGMRTAEEVNDMSITVTKRNGAKVPFNGNKIVAAILAANGDVPENERIDVGGAKKIADKVQGMPVKEIGIEEIQDLVETGLMELGKYELAKAYIKYRYEHQLVRQANTTDEKMLTLLRGTNRELAEENANKNTRMISTQRDYIAGIASRDMTFRLLLPKDVAKAHESGAIHFHDADYFIQQSHNCCLVNIRDMLDNGTMMNDKLIETPKSFQVACTVTTQIIAAVSSNQYGGQSIDVSALGKYLRRSRDKYDRKLREATKDAPLTEEQIHAVVNAQVKEELKAGVQTIQYQINTLMTTNGQSPFVTLFLYLRDDDPYIEENAAIIEEILRQRIQGIKNEKGVYITPAFPKLVYVLDENNNLTGGKYDYLTHLACKCVAKRMYPDFISAKKMKEDYQGNVYSPMGCRSFLSPWKDETGHYKFEGRFNQGVVSLNLPQIGIIANGDERVFWNLLDERLDICFKALMCRHEHLKGTLSDAAPIIWQHGAVARLKPGETIDKLLEGGYSTISLGYIGVYEMTMAMKGCSHTTEEGFEFAYRVMKYLRETCDRWKEETGLGFALYGTPAESLCYRFAEIDKKRFGSIPNITDKGYYTNSYHVDVREPINVFDKFTFEAQFQTLSSGGKISYAEIPNLTQNVQAIEEVVKFIYDNIMYAEFNTKSDYCQECGFDGEILIKTDENGDPFWECPNCGNRNRDTMNVVRRTCGYLGEKWWNVGKTKEISQRVTHL